VFEISHPQGVTVITCPTAAYLDFFHTEQRAGGIMPPEVAVQGRAGNLRLSFRFQDLVDHAIRAAWLIAFQLDGPRQHLVAPLAHAAQIAPLLAPQRQHAMVDDPVVFAAQRACRERARLTVRATELPAAQFTETFFPRRFDFALQQKRSQHRAPENRPLLIVTIVHA